MSVFEGRTLCFLSGASRGFGAELAQQLAPKLSADSVFILSARDSAKLEQMEKKVLAINSKVKCIRVVLDLQSLDDENLKKAFAGVPNGPFKNLLILHNAGSLGDVTILAHQHLKNKDIIDYYSANVTSTILLNNILLSKFSSVENKFVVNLSSLCAFTPFKSLSLYCSGKAARDMYFQVLSKEMPALRILTYSPGMMETGEAGMVAHLREQSVDEGLRKTFADMKLNKQLVPVADSVKVLIKTLEKNSFKNAERVDYAELK